MAQKVKIKIDGKQYEVDANQSVLKAALSVGVEIPHFCWHEKLSVSGNCRMCMVEIKPGPPKLQLACATPVRDGMEVITNSERVKKARAAMLQFLLINHPLDCPVCDKAYECPLQEYTYKYGTTKSLADLGGLTQQKRRFERKQISDKLYVVMDRCIHCTRCQRYFEEIVGIPSIGRTWRAANTLMDTFEKIEGNFQLNAVDLCPTGALGERNFRFKARVWDLQKLPSVCSLCSVGCNVYVWSKDNRIYRITPRRNERVNSIWMCDTGRLEFEFANSETRAKRARWEGKALPFEEVAEKVGAELARIVSAHGAQALVFYVAPTLTVEEMFAVKLLAETLGGVRVGFIGGVNTLPVREVGSGYLTETLVSTDATPNTAGAERLGLEGGAGIDFLSKVVEEIEAGTVKALVVLGEDLFELKRGEGLPEPSKVAPDRLEAALGRLDLLVVADLFDTTKTATLAKGFLPLVSHFEKDGSFINRQGYLQSFRKAFVRTDLPEAKSVVELVDATWRGVNPEFAGIDVEKLRILLKEREPVFARVDWQKLALGGVEQIPEEGWALKAAKQEE